MSISQTRKIIVAQNNSNNVSFGKPKAGGALFFAPIGTTVPTNASSTLDAAFKNLGYISEDGLVNGIETDTESVTEWGGAEVLSGQTSFVDMFTFNMIEANADSLAFYYGADNVEVSGDTITVKQNVAELPNCVFVAELVLTGGRVKRIVVANGKLADRSGEISYVSGEPVAYPVQLKAYPDGQNNTHIEYFANIAS